MSNGSPVNRMYEVTKERRLRHRDRSVVAGVIPLPQIFRSCHLTPRLEDDLPTALDPVEVLDSHDVFCVNESLDTHSYLTDSAMLCKVAPMYSL